MKYFPGLNGIRAIAALSVVFLHITIALKKFNLDPHILGTLENGEPKGFLLGAFGVSMFFVLSGFLITYLLQGEKDKGDINVRKFYMRRILRIWPLYFLYLLTAVAVILITGVELNGTSLLMYIFFAANVPFILGTPLPFLGHYWSLGVEEQFYLFWPWLNKKRNYIIGVTTLLIVLLIGLKIVIHFLYPASIYERALHFTRYHCMLIGALGALLYKNEHSFFMKLADNKITQLICWSIVALAALNIFHIAWFIDDEIISMVTLFIIIGQIQVKNRMINLETKLLNFLGKISYGIYVVHPLLIIFLSVAMRHVDLPLPLRYTLIYLLVPATTIFLAYLSYRFFESHFLKLKKRFEVVPAATSFDTKQDS
jgi:peptidoglycan/LPS O-acetylase OafA/YrhL